MNINDLVSRLFFLTIIYIVGATPDDKVNMLFMFCWYLLNHVCVFKLALLLNLNKAVIYFIINILDCVCGKKSF